MLKRGSPIERLLVAGVGIALAFATSGTGAEVGLTIELRVGGVSVDSIKPAGLATLEPFTMQYTGSSLVESTSLAWQLTATGSPDVATTSKISGNIVLSNHSPVTREYEVTVTTPALTACPINNEMGGSSIVTLLLDPAGGSLESVHGVSFWRAMIDGVVVATLFDRVSAGLPNWGTLLIGPESFGDPIPSALAPGVGESIALQYTFSLTPGESVSISSIFVVAFLDIDCPIPGDLDGDGIVDGTDLGLLLSLWGTDDRTADINGDGIVDGADLGVLLQGWTR